MLQRKLLSYLLTLGCSISISIASPLKSDEYVMFIPDIAYQIDDHTIAITVQAWVYEKERRLGMTTALTNYLGIDKSQLTAQQQTRLYARTQLFRVDSESNKRIKIQFNNKSIYSLPKTNKEGRSTAIIKLSAKGILAPHNMINYKLYKSGNPAGANKGNSIFIPNTGLSIISDIDDTIKDSQVTNKKQLLINTFINEFKSVKGMSDWYNQLANINNTAFHYVSSSPIQLYPALKTFMDEAHFPPGSFHLRESTTWDTVIAKEGESVNHKKTQIEKLLATFPARKFILIGDSGEADPEIYADIMRRYPTQIHYIAIRNVTEEDSHSTRYLQTFKGLDTHKWTIFKDNIPDISF